MTHTLSAKEQALSKIFSDDYVFTIPTYQRPYSWGTDQAQELLDDLLGYMRAGSSKLDEMAPYFLGSIVLIKRESVADSQVVDGQQRLTTLTLLLPAIRATVADKSVQDGITKCIYEHGNVVCDVPSIAFMRSDRKSRRGWQGTGVATVAASSRVVSASKFREAGSSRKVSGRSFRIN